MRRPRWIRDRTVPIGTPVDCGDLLVRQVADVAEHDRNPELLGERGERLLDLVRQPGLRLVGRRRGREHAAGVVRERVGGASLPTSHLVEEHVRHDSSQPAFEGSRLVALEALADPQQRFLHQILCVVVIAGQAVGHVVEEAPVVARDLFPRGNTVSHGQERRWVADQFPDPLREGQDVRDGRVRCSWARRGSASSWCPSSTPFLNSLLACPRERASLGSRVLPKRRRTMARTMMSSVGPMFMGPALSRGYAPGYRRSGVIAARGWRAATQFQVVDGGRRRTGPRPTPTTRVSTPRSAQPAACSRICSTVPTRRPTRHCVEVTRRARRAGSWPAGARSAGRGRLRPPRTARRGRASASRSRDRGRSPRTRARARRDARGRRRASRPSTCSSRRRPRRRRARSRSPLPPTKIGGVGCWTALGWFDARRSTVVARRRT